MMEQDATKKRGSISQRFQLTIIFITVMYILDWVNSLVVYLLNITIVYLSVQLIDVFSSLIFITSLVELFCALLFFLIS